MSPKKRENAAREISLGQFVALLILTLDEKNVPMPLQNQEKWHRLFYQLKTAGPATGRPDFFDKLRFEQEGRFPKSQDLSEYLNALHWSGFVSVANPTYDRLSIDQDVKLNLTSLGLPKIEDKKLKKFVDATVHEAAASFREQPLN